MKKDIENWDDIRLVMDSFYQKVKTDDLIGHFFKHLSEEKWEKHLQIMYGFWHNAIFFSGSYSGNPMEVHKKVHAISPLDLKHFERWNQLFIETTDEFFEGKTTESMKQTAINISTVIQLKILGKHLDL